MPNGIDLNEWLRESGRQRMKKGRNFRKHMRAVRRCNDRCGDTALFTCERFAARRCKESVHA